MGTAGLRVLLALVAACAVPAERGSAQPATPQDARTLPAPQSDASLLGYSKIVVPGPVLRFETTEGVFRIALFSAEAPRLTRAFRERVEDGLFRREGLWRTRADGVQLGTPGTDVTAPGAVDVRSGLAGSRPIRDSNSVPFLATLGAHGFEQTGLKPIEGSVMIDQRFIVEGQLFQREYFVALKPGFRRGEVVGHVITGLDVLRRLDSRDGILSARVE
jgi:hypothetical protein